MSKPPPQGGFLLCGARWPAPFLPQSQSNQIVAALFSWSQQTRIKITH
jgi:hypothetical protein